MPSAPWTVLDDHSGIAGQILGEEGRHQAAGGVGAAAGLRADDHGDGLAAKRDRFLRQCWRSGEHEEKPRRRRQYIAQAPSPVVGARRLDATPLA